MANRIIKIEELKELYKQGKEIVFETKIHNSIPAIVSIDGRAIGVYKAHTKKAFLRSIK